MKTLLILPCVVLFLVATSAPAGAGERRADENGACALQDEDALFPLNPSGNVLGM